ncbi:(R)-stereoselective amidase [Hartmannibacter diazotrophicus]|uniref:(R)-stereoselective amidase n=1 Tax=Hartmannibacter diazotrophicus TaxID=1482074 RepID=A0A2C9DBY8_9HYPH|nr:carbon-nitrogen hydrolase family protein [Hartmannibacter diazotrophicus]SON57817.1 (R)-stereoselective amidase [Hartmannibacter diazotrophicus]
MDDQVCIGAVSVGPADGSGPSLPDTVTVTVAELSRRGADVVILPELFARPYVAGDDPIRWRHLAEPLDGPTVRWAERLSNETGVALLFGMALEAGSGLPLNAAVLVRPGSKPEVAGTKIHLPPAASGAFGEGDHFSPGPPEVGIVEIAGIRLAVVICYDRRFPECWRLAASGGAEVVAVLVGGPADGDPDGLFAAELRTHARANAVYAIAASRFGTETLTGHAVRHDGETLVVGPDGAVLSQAPAGGSVLATIIKQDLERARAFNPTAARLRLPSFGQCSHKEQET